MARRKNQPEGRPVEKQHYPPPPHVSVTPVVELGVTGTRISAGLVFEERIGRLTSERMRETYRQMADNDPVVGAILLAIEQTLRSVDWRVDPEDGSDQARRDADFVWECMHDMSHTWQDFVSDVLSMLVYGWSAFELVYKYRLGGNEESDPTLRSRYRDGRLGWRKFGYRSQLTLWRWATDRWGGLRGLYQMDPNNPGRGAIFIPIEKLLLFRTKPAGGSPEGRSILRPAVRPWYFKKYLEEIEAIGIERDAVGIPKVKVPEGVDIFAPGNAQLLSALRSMIQDLRADKTSGVILPAGYDIELVGGAGSRTFDTAAVIARYDQRIAMSVLAQFIILGSERVGSYALASQHKDLFTVALDGWLAAIEQVLNQYAVRRLVYLNSMSTLPRITHEPILQPTLTELSAFLRDTVNVNLITPDLDLERWLRKRANLPVRREEPTLRSEEQEVLSKLDWLKEDTPVESALDILLPRERLLSRLTDAYEDEEKANRVYDQLRKGMRAILSDGHSKERRRSEVLKLLEVMHAE